MFCDSRSSHECTNMMVNNGKLRFSLKPIGGNNTATVDTCHYKVDVVTFKLIVYVQKVGRYNAYYPFCNITKTVSYYCY